MTLFLYLEQMKFCCKRIRSYAAKIRMLRKGKSVIKKKYLFFLSVYSHFFDIFWVVSQIFLKKENTWKQAINLLAIRANLSFVWVVLRSEKFPWLKRYVVFSKLYFSLITSRISENLKKISLENLFWSLLESAYDGRLFFFLIFTKTSKNLKSSKKTLSIRDCNSYKNITNTIAWF